MNNMGRTTLKVGKNIKIVLVSFLIASCAMSPNRSAESLEPQKAQHKAPVLSAAVYKELTDAQMLADGGDFKQAELQLKSMLTRKTLNYYERAMVFNWFGFIYGAQGKFEKMLASHLTILEMEGLPDSLVLPVLLSVVKNYMAKKEYDLALEYMERYGGKYSGIETVSIRAQLHFLRNNYTAAIKLLELEIEEQIETKRKHELEYFNPSLFSILFLRKCYQVLGNSEGIKKSNELLSLYHPDEKGVDIRIVPDEGVSVVNIGPISPEKVRFIRGSLYFIYPAQASENKIEGYVTVRMDIDKKGNVIDPVVIDSKPAGVFDEAVLKAFKQAKARRTLVDGEFVDFVGIEKTISFKMEEGELN